MHTDLTQGSVTGSMLRFAAPLILSNLLQQLYNVADTLIDGREVRTCVFGFTVLTRPVSGGLELQSVDPNSDAYAKGLQAGDIITAVNGQPVTGTQDLARVKLSRGPGDTVEITYLRDGVSCTVEIALVDSELID